MTDIYGAILYGIAKVGTSTIRPTDLARVLDQDMTQNAPGRQQIVASLGHMRDIAHEVRGTGDPALDYKNDELHMLDPFLSFYLQYGSWDLPKPAS